MVRVAVLFHRLGPYHHARLRAAGRLLDVTAVELSACDETYAWDPVGGADSFRRVTLFHDRDVVHEPAGAVVRRVETALEDIRPEAVAIPGWAERAALAALSWCLRAGVPAVVMSDSTAGDARRLWWKESIKGRVVRLCRAALAAGRPHAEYLVRLGMPPDRVFVGYDVVDNDHFARGAADARADARAVRRRLGLPERYFLASNRFIPKKNLRGLLQAFADYRAAAGRGAWDLVLLGDGAGRAELERLRGQLELVGAVHMPGFVQYGELPAYYGLAGAFVHASTTEQWGLVVNEAMAAGLPVLVSRRCGCAADLIEEGRNGFTFDPLDPAGLGRHLLLLAGGEYDRGAMGLASAAVIGRWTPARFADGLARAARAGLDAPRPRFGRLDRAILSLLTANRTRSDAPAARISLCEQPR